LQQPYSRYFQHKRAVKQSFRRFPTATLGIHGWHRAQSRLQKEAMIIGGVEDHVHALLVLPPSLPLSKVVQFLKGSSSKWINDTQATALRFAWQEGYGAFSVSASQTSEVVRYIKNQRSHHEKKSFEEEFLTFLKKYGVTYDPAYVLG
jgi:hypothetical protein